MKYNFTRAVCAAILAGGLSTAATAEMFHGFDPENVGSESPSAENLKAMVAEAAKVSPPRNGENYVFGYTMWGGNSPFSIYNKQGLEKIGDMAGITIVTADNEWDPNKNVANAETFATRNVDFVINSLLDVQFAPAVRAPLDEKNIPLVALDIPVPGSKWVGVDNGRAGFHAGTYLAQSAMNRWGDAAKDAKLIILSFPLVGPNGKLRNMSQEAGVKATLGLPDDQVTWLETDATPEGGFKQMNNILTRIDPDKPLLIAAFSDEVLSGALRAVRVGGLQDNTIAVGMGGEMLEQVANEEMFIATMSFFPERYADAAIPVALATLASKELPTSVFAYSELVTPAKTCKVNADLPCNDLAEWAPEDITVDEAAFDSYVTSLHADSYFEGFEMLLPPEK